jgi:hypothetical protein
MQRHLIVLTRKDDEQRHEIVSERHEHVGKRDRCPRDVYRLFIAVTRRRQSALGDALDERQCGCRQGRHQREHESRLKVGKKVACFGRHDR